MAKRAPGEDWGLGGGLGRLDAAYAAAAAIASAMSAEPAARLETRHRSQSSWAAQLSSNELASKAACAAAETPAAADSRAACAASCGGGGGCKWVAGADVCPKSLRTIRLHASQESASRDQRSR
eukprot:scaffold233907_cov36-Tisochrysis_lutea.AAC.1